MGAAIVPKAWFCIPSARPIAEVLPVVSAWKERGYGVALWRDDPFAPADCAGYAVTQDKFAGDFGFGCDVLFLASKYPGYAQSVNAMAKHVLSHYPEVDWIVCAGDDTTPDPNKTGDEIAAELSKHFQDMAWPKHWSWDSKYKSHVEALAAGAYAEEKKQGLWSADPARIYSTWGVCQPVGDDWADNLGKIILRIAGSPWLGRSWCEHAWGGRGPLWPEFRHQFVDEALQVYAQSLGVFLQRPDLTHHHAHAQRDGKSRPAPHMAEWNSQKHWQESKAIFERLKSTNFAECQPIP